MSERQKKWMASMIKKHGSVEAVREFQRMNAAKSSRNKGKKGGFASLSKEERTRISREAAKKRWGEGNYDNH